MKRYRIWMPGEPDGSTVVDAENRQEAARAGAEALDCARHGYAGELRVMDCEDGTVFRGQVPA